MALTSKQRAFLRGLGSQIDPVVQIGKEGVTDSVVQSALEALKTHELIKCKVLENSLLTAREACDELSAACKADPVQVIGTKFVLYKVNGKEAKIQLPKSKK